MKLFNTCSIVLLGAAAVHAADTGATDSTPSTGTGASTPSAGANVGEGVGDSQLKNASTSKLMQLAGPLLSCGKDMGQDWLMNLGIANALGCMKGGVKKAGGALRGVKKVAQYPKSAVCMAGLAAVPILIQRGHGAALVEKVRETISELSSQLSNLTNRLPSGDDDAPVPKTSAVSGGTSAVSGGANNTTPKEPEVVQQAKGNSISRQAEEVLQMAGEEASAEEKSEQEASQQKASQQDASQEEASQEEDEGAPAAPANAPASTNPKKSKGCFSCCAAA